MGVKGENQMKSVIAETAITIIAVLLSLVIFAIFVNCILFECFPQLKEWFFNALM